MSRYMWRKYRQKLKKWAQLDSSHREESRKVPLTPAERSKAYRERKRMCSRPAEYQCGRVCTEPRRWNSRGDTNGVFI